MQIFLTYVYDANVTKKWQKRLQIGTMCNYQIQNGVSLLIVQNTSDLPQLLI